MTNRSRLLRGLLALVMIAGLLPGTTASAGAPTIGIYITDQENWGEIANLSLTRGDTFYLTLVVEDEQNQPLADYKLRVQSEIGNRINPDTPATDANGRAEIVLEAVENGMDNLRITGPGAGTTLALVVQDLGEKDHGFAVGLKEQDLSEMPGAVAWRTLGNVRVEERNGFYYPTFSSEVKKLDGTNVTLQGFMLPLENSEKQRHFLLSATPPSCFFCLPGGPESIVEIKTSEAVDYTFDPVTINGKLELLQGGDDFGLFYRVTSASRVKPQ